MSTVLRSDRARQVVVTLSAVAMMVGTLFGIGVFGTRVEEAAGGSLSATATLVAPAGPAFSIWSVIYTGLIAYVVWQWFPRHATSPRGRTIGWLAAATMLLNAGWLLVTQWGWLWASVAVIVTLVVLLGVLVRRLTLLPAPDAPPAARTVERVVVDGTFGLYLGWVSVATVANITATLVAAGIDPGTPVSEYLAVTVLVVAALVGVVLAAAFGGRLAVGAAMAWGLGWIAIGRLIDVPSSQLTGTAAAAAAAVALGAPLLVRGVRGTRRPVPVRVSR